MINRKISEGKLGEDLAVEFLRKNGFEIIGRNFRTRNGEIDIIAIENKTLVFIEVKTRTSNQYGSPIEAITPWKLRTLIRTAEYYKAIHKKLPDLMRIDAVLVCLDGNNSIKTIDIVKNITL